MQAALDKLMAAKKRTTIVVAHRCVCQRVSVYTCAQTDWTGFELSID